MIPPPGALDGILHSQRRWAEGAGILLDSDGYAHRLADNLLEEMSSATYAEFRAGSGAELGEHGGRGKMQALHSSSAFACNVYGYWRERAPSRVARALGAQSNEWALSFEHKVGTGVLRAIANLDIWLESKDGAVIAVESKFCEPYRVKGKQSELASAYRLTPSSSAWSDVGLGRCHEIAAATSSGGLRWKSLDVFQLLKHLLALKRNGQGNSSLCYAWFDRENDESKEHRREVERFAELLGADGAFSSVTHQEVVARLRREGEVGHSAYFAYLATRYGL